ncbi:Tim44 domain-containing protein [Desulfocurvus vexinensis]|uniref:Tim44 domain-containing protein n=1 Tax=Desulfocurvus vexinensis TaxID=399548 RepID=UPI0005568775|nr:TIM44-like domain-containing protein [Desulfocurvus vexinensis]
MRIIVQFFAVALLALAVCAVDASPADAARFGGGKSFGGNKSFNQNYSKPAPTQRQTGQQQMGAPARPGMGAMGGMLGGLLAGTLLGSLFFGQPFAGGGMLDILLIGGVLFLLFRLLRGRRPMAQPAGAGMGYGGPPSGPMTRDAGPGAAWGGLASAADARPEVSTPPGFDEAEFLQGAKAAYGRLQTSWDARDLDDIRQFTTDAVFSEIGAQAQADPGPSRTEVLMVDARLLEARAEGPATLATVYFDALLRENQGGTTAQVREVWHFRRQDDVSGGMWLLDGIQQLEQ